jgi:flagellar basal-body rod protein FlgF/flagellar basal-body rod protein FlgG
MAPPGVTPQVPTDAKVTQGAIEKSNVQSVMEMTRMIDITRAYTQIAQILQNQSDLRRTALDKLSDVPTA